MNQNEKDVMVHYDFTQQSINMNNELKEIAEETLRIAKQGNAHNKNEDFKTLTKKQERLFSEQKKHFELYKKFLEEKLS